MEHLKAYVRRARAYRNLGQFDLAELDFQYVLEHDHDSRSGGWVLNEIRLWEIDTGTTWEQI